MKFLPLTSLGLLLLAGCSHDGQPVQTSPDVTVDPSTTASATPTATADAGNGGHTACDAVRCRGGMACQMIDGKPTCNAAP